MSKVKIYEPLPVKTWEPIRGPMIQDVGKITFPTDAKWIMQIVNEKGIRKINFNTEDFPDLAPNDFAKEVIKIMHESSLLDDLINQEVDARLNSKEKR